MDDCSRDNSVSIEPTNQCRSRQINKESQDQRLDSTNKTVPVQRTTWKGSKKFRTLRDRRCLAAIKGIGMLLRCLSRLSHSHYTEQTFLVTFLQKIIHKKIAERHTFDILEWNLSSFTRHRLTATAAVPLFQTIILYDVPWRWKKTINSDMYYNNEWWKKKSRVYET